MTVFQLFVGIVILFLGIFKPLLYKPVAEKYLPKFSPIFVSFWMVAGIIMTFPFVCNKFGFSIDVMKNNVFAFGAAILKGWFVWGAVWSFQIINKKSTSTSVFFPFISLSFASLIMNLFFDENLKLIHLMSIVLLGILGGGFYFCGDAKRMNAIEKRMFVIAILFAGGCSVTDHVGIKGIGWYPYLVVSNVAMFLWVLIKGCSFECIKNIFTEKQIVIAGIFTICYEVIILASMIAVMPVSFVSFFMRLSAPIVMIFSAITFKEQTITNQLVFGCLAILFALPMMFVAR